MAKKDKLNGSVDALAQAMRKVFQEAMEVTVTPIRDEMSGMEDRLKAQINDQTSTTNKNVQAQLAQNRKDVADDMRKIIKGN